MNKLKFFKTFTILLFLLVHGTIVFAKPEDTNINTEIIEKSAKEKDLGEKVFEITEDNRILQKFSWDGDKTIYRYDFVLEKLEGNSYKQIQVIPLEPQVQEIELPLEIGKYRYCLNVYNFLGGFDYKTDYIEVKIQKTAFPIITEITPSIIYLEEVQDGIFTVEGFELSKETRFTVENDFFEISAILLETDSESHKAKIQINPELINNGKYYIRAVNPGGLEDISENFRVTFKKPMDLDISAGIAGMFLLDMMDNTPHNEKNGADSLIEFFSNNREGIFWPGVSGRITFIPLKTTRFYMGGGVTASTFWLDYTNRDPDTKQKLYTIHAPTYSAYADVNFQFVLRKKMPFKTVADIHGGLGAMGFAGLWIQFSNNSTTDNIISLAPSFNVGASLQVYVLNRLYIEGNCDFSYTQMKDMPVFHLQPTLSAGWQF